MRTIEIELSTSTRAEQRFPALLFLQINALGSGSHERASSSAFESCQFRESTRRKPLMQDCMHRRNGCKSISGAVQTVLFVGSTDAVCHSDNYAVQAYFGSIGRSRSSSLVGSVVTMAGSFRSQAQICLADHDCTFR